MGAGSINGDGKHVGAVMSEASQFRQYAEEALVGSASPQPKKRNGR